MCGHDQLTAATEAIIQLLHAYNREWMPSRSRWMISAKKLGWMPESFSTVIDDATMEVRPNTESLLHRRALLKNVLDNIQARFRHDKLLASPLESFVATHPGLGYAHNFEEWKRRHCGIRKNAAPVTDESQS